MLTFLFWVPIYTYINFWTTMKFGFQVKLFMKEPGKIYRVFYFIDVGQKIQILAQINIF